MSKGTQTRKAHQMLTDHIAYTKTADVFGTGKKNHKVHTTTADHPLRRVLDRENGQWTIKGEFIVEGPRGAIYRSYRYSEYADKLTLINEKTLQRVEYVAGTVQPRSE